MPAERAGYTVTMFLLDVSPSMGTIRTVTTEGTDGEEHTVEMTNLEWSLQYVKMKIQEMIYNGRKTDQCGVILFGSEATHNIVNERDGGYEHVQEYIRVGQPNAGTLAKVDALRPSTVSGDAIDGLVVAIETQATYLAKKPSWTRKIALVTDGENPIELEDWEAVVTKMNTYKVSLAIVGVDFDDEDYPFVEEDKPHIKKTNEKFYHEMMTRVDSGIIGTCTYALEEVNRPDIKSVKSSLVATTLSIGNTSEWEEAIEISVKASKCTAIARPKSFKKYALREGEVDAMDVDGKESKDAYAQLKSRTEYFVDPTAGESDDEDDVKKEEEYQEDMEALAKKQREKEAFLQKVDKEQLVRGFKYGTTYVPCPDGQFPRLPTTKGIEIWGFFPRKNVRRELAMGEVQYIWANEKEPQQQVALSSIVQAMAEKDSAAIARWVTRDGMDPKMGVVVPIMFENVDCLMWVQMPFADDVRKYTFASLTRLVNKKGEVLTEHTYLPTTAQQLAMDAFVDNMDLMTAGDKDEKGNRTPWFDTRYSFNASIHRVKQAQFHSAITSDLEGNPLPAPHHELMKYFEPPRKVVKRCRDALEQCKTLFNVREVPKKAAKARKDGHEHAAEEDDALLLLDRKAPGLQTQRTQSQFVHVRIPSTSPQKDQEKELAFAKKGKEKEKAEVSHDSATESDTEDGDEDFEMIDGPSLQQSQKQKKVEDNDNDEILLDKPRERPLPTPARSVSPQVDPGRAPGRIVGMTYPLRDFENNLKTGDVVTKAVEDLSWVLKEIVMRPFASRRYNECSVCMRKMRQVCLEEDEIDAWNAFMQDLKTSCLSRSGNIEFWERLKKEGKDLSLINNIEAQKRGGFSDVTEMQAQQFLA